MSNPFEPPSAPVADATEAPTPSWLRTLMLVLGFAAAALVLAWLVVPALVSRLLVPEDLASGTMPAELLALDLGLSFLAFALACYAAARLSNGHEFVAAGAIGAIGWLVYFIEVDGWNGILSSPYPVWYEFFPSHLLAAATAIVLARRARR